MNPSNKKKPFTSDKSKYFIISLLFLVLFASVSPLVYKKFTKTQPTYTITVTPISDKKYAPAHVTPIKVKLQAKNVYVVDLTNHSTLFERDSTKKISPASTTKLITALTVLDSCALTDTVTVGEEISYVAADASKAHLKQGNCLTIKQLLEALLLPSGNDAAYVLAAHTGKVLAGSDSLSHKDAIQLFIKAMNKKAVSLGATDTHFASPDGYDAPGQYSTAKDLSLFASECLNVDCLRKIMGCYQVTETLCSGEKVTYTNSNYLLNPDSEFYDQDVIGLKTGSSKEAGYCVISASKTNGHTILCVVMGSTKNGRFSDSENLYKALRNNSR